MPSKALKPPKVPAINPPKPKPVGEMKPVSLPTPARSPVGTIGDLGKDAVVQKITSLFGEAKKEDVIKFVDESWVSIKTWKVTNLLPYVKNRFGTVSGGIGGITVGSTDQVRDKTAVGTSIFILKGGKFLNYAVPANRMTVANTSGGTDEVLVPVRCEALAPGRQISSMRSAKWTIDTTTVVSVPIPEIDLAKAILEAAIPPEEFPGYEFDEYETFAFVGQFKPSSDEFSNPMPVNNDLKFTVWSSKLVDWDINLWVHARQFGEVYINVLGEGEMAQYRQLETAGKADFLGALLSGQVAIFVAKVGKEAFREYNGVRSMECDAIAILAYPDSLPPVMIDPRPERVEQPKPVTDVLTGTSIATLPESKEIKSIITRIHETIPNASDGDIQGMAISIQAEFPEDQLSIQDALNILVTRVEYTNPKKDTPVLKVLRATAVENNTWDFSYQDFMDLCAVDEKYKQFKLDENVFNAFVAANKP